jgi:hypothetical protein
MDIVFFSLENMVLQTSQNIDLSLIAIVVSSVTATILASMVIITWKNIHENTKATYSQLLRDIFSTVTWIPRRFNNTS